MSMRLKYHIALVLFVSNLFRATAVLGDEAATEHEIKFVRLPNAPYTATLSSIVDALPLSTSPASATAAANPQRSPSERSPTEVASLLKLAQLAPLLESKASPPETSSRTSSHSSSHTNGHNSLTTSNHDRLRWSAVQGQAEQLLKWRRAPMDSTDKGDDRLRGGTPPPSYVNVSAALGPKWRVNGGTTVKPRDRHAFLKAVPGSALIPQTATVGVSSNVGSEPTSSGRPLAVTIVSHPVDRCLDALLSRWEQKLLGKQQQEQQIRSQSAPYGSRLGRETVNGTALVLSQLEELVRQQENGKMTKGNLDGVWREKRASQNEKVSLDELVSQVTASSGTALDSMWGDLEEDKEAKGGSGGSSAVTPLRCRNEQWRLLRPKPPGGLSVSKLKKFPFQAGEEWGLTPLLVLAQFDLVSGCISTCRGLKSCTCSHA